MESLKEYLTFKSGAQKVFIIIKPGFLQYTENIMETLKDAGWVVDRTIVKKLLSQESKKLYEVHKKESFYEDLCNYMSSDISRACILKKIGSKLDDPFETIAKIKDNIRTEYGESDMRNVMHSSDSYESMVHEASVYFNL